MIKALLRIRGKQIYRSLIEIGLLRAMFLSVLVGMFTLFLYTSATDKLAAQLISLGVVAAIIAVQIKRADKLFLKTNFPNYKTLILVEYLIISLPFVAILWVHNQWFASANFLALSLVIQIEFKARFSSLNTKLQTLVPSNSFEWKAGLRSYLFLLVSVWFITALGSFTVAAVPVGILILGVLVFSFYERAEPYQMVVAYELKASSFLLWKIVRHIQLFSILIIPLLVLFVWFHAALWYIAVAEFFVLVSIQVFAILTKYAFYVPNSKSAAAQTIASIGLLGGLFPGFLPVIWAISLWFYYKSVRNLKYYLDDYNQ